MAVRKKNGRWHWRFQVDGRTWCGSTALKATKQNKPGAQKKETEARELVKEGRNPRQHLIVRPFNEAAVDFLKWAEGEYRDHPNSHRRLVTSFASLSAFFLSTPVGAITEGMLEDFKSGRRRNSIREVTLRHDLYALSKFFQYAIKQRWAARNPVRGMEMPSDADAIRIHVLTATEEETYFHQATGDLHDLGRLILNQGCRPEEVLRLRQVEVDLDNRRLKIARGKTKAARRTLTLTQESMRILAQRLNKGSEWVFPSPKMPGKPRGRLNGQHDTLLFRLNHVKVGDKWVEKPREGQIQFVLYDLRHTFATHLAEAGVDLATLAAILGHSSLRVVQRYVHVTQEHQRAEMLRYDAMLTARTGNEKQPENGRASFGPVVM